MSIKDTDFYPMPVHGNAHIGPGLLAALFMRVKAGIFGNGAAPPKRLTDDAWQQAGYCLDAPAMMPAGSTVSLFLGDDLGHSGEQACWLREDG